MVISKSNRTKISIIVLSLIAFASLLFLILYYTRSSADELSAILSVSPSSKNLNVNDDLNVNIKLTSNSDAIGGVGIKVSHSANLHYNSYDSSGSVFDMIATKPSESNNVIFFEEVNTGTGFIGSNGQVMTLNFTATSAGTGTVTINQAASEVDTYADGTNILQSVTNGSYTVQTPSSGSGSFGSSGSSGSSGSNTGTSGGTKSGTSTNSTKTPASSSATTTTTPSNNTSDNTTATSTAANTASTKNKLSPWWGYGSAAIFVLSLGGIIVILALKKRSQIA